MRAGSISRLDAMRLLHPDAMEASLLELFMPTRSATTTAAIPPQTGHEHLWRAEAIHRAKNMAQLSTSFADLVDHPTRNWLPAKVTAQARRLSRAYEELGLDATSHAPVPCAALLIEIATSLAALFGRSRRVAITTFADPVLLPPDVRRAMLLICSELVINALKYGYPNGVGGMISVSLLATQDVVELIVEDDGVGAVESYAPGHGGGLLEQLRAVLDATATRSAGRSGHGFRVSTRVQINVSLSKKL